MMRTKILTKSGTMLWVRVWEADPKTIVAKSDQELQNLQEVLENPHWRKTTLWLAARSTKHPKIESKVQKEACLQTLTAWLFLSNPKCSPVLECQQVDPKLRLTLEKEQPIPFAKSRDRFQHRTHSPRRNSQSLNLPNQRRPIPSRTSTSPRPKLKCSSSFNPTS